MSLEVEDASLVEIFNEIKSQTDLVFLYGPKVKRHRKTYSLTLERVSVKEAIKALADQVGMEATLVDQTINVKLKPQQAPRIIYRSYEEKIITGTITDAETGEPLPGASVRVKGTTVGGIADANGKFSIQLPDGYNTLLISFIGYATEEVEVGEQTTINVSLTSSYDDLEEVIVVAYGTQKKSDVTGAIGSASERDFNKGIVANPGQLLQGKIAGVNVSNVSGEPGAAQDVIIRGIGSLRSGTTPLYVVDGFVLDNSTTGVASNPLNFINPQDIASIDVLKDASAAAIYGARAANGVIVITTKRGKEGKTEMNFSATTAWSTMAKKIDVFSADEFVQQVNAIDGNLFNAGGNTDWQDELTQTANSNNVNLSMSGAASDRFSYYISAGVEDQEGILLNSRLRRYSGRVNLTQKALNGRLNVDYNFSGTKTENTRPNGSIIVDMLQLNPTIPVSTDGQPTLLDDKLNPTVLNDIYSDESDNNRILANIAPSIEIIKGLTYRINLGVDYSTTNRDVQLLPYALLEGFELGSLTSITTRNENQLLENTLTYQLDLDKSNFTILAGHSYQKTLVQQKSFRLSGFADNGVNPIYQDQTSTQDQPTTLSAFAVENELQSFFGRVNYQYEGKYLATATFRADGSSKFGENNKYGYFPSFALGWNISKESFMSASVFSNLKLRASWGQTGNQEIPAK
ncbi:MAG: SusC/RagA family TonB-linked outer membrane protein, partial [Bacteroidota bacterium]